MDIVVQGEGNVVKKIQLLPLRLHVLMVRALPVIKHIVLEIIFGKTTIGMNQVYVEIQTI